jgi:hypothetical protein
MQLCRGGFCWCWNHVHDRPFVAAFAERNSAIYEGEERVVTAQTYVFAGVVFSTPLTDDDVTCDGRLTTENLYAQPFADAVAPVLRATDPFLVCHFRKKFSVFSSLF